MEWVILHVVFVAIAGALAGWRNAQEDFSFSDEEGAWAIALIVFVPIVWIAIVSIGISGHIIEERRENKETQ